eukprot:208705_1
MDDISNLLEQLQKYQHQNKNLLSENAKLHAKSKRLKMEKKQLKLQLQTQLQSTTKTDDCIEHQTLQFVNHHHIEMQKMIDNLLSHPTIIKSSTYKDLQYIASKLSYIQSKVALATNGKTSTTSPPDLHSQRHHTLTKNQLKDLAPQSMHSYRSDSSYSSRRRSKKHKKKNTTRQDTSRPNLNMLASRSSPYKPTLNKTKQAPNGNRDPSAYGSPKIYHKRTRSASNKKQSIQQQLKQLEFGQFLNTNTRKHSHQSNDHESTCISPLTGPILNQLRAPEHRKDRSTIIASSSMAVSRATSVVEDLESVMVDCDVDIPPLPPSPHIHNMEEHIKTKRSKSNHKRHSVARGTNHRKGRRLTHKQAVQFIPENRTREYGAGDHPTTPNSGYSAYYENDTTPILSNSLRFHTGSMDTNEESLAAINCMLSPDTQDTNHERTRKRAQTRHVLHSATQTSSNPARHSNVDWYGPRMIKPSLTNPPSKNIKEAKRHKGSHSVAIKNVCVRPQLDLNTVSLKLHNHANRSVPAAVKSPDNNSGSAPSGGTLKSNSVIIHESQETETTIRDRASSGSSGSTTNTLSVSSSHVNFIYGFKHESVHNIHKTDSMNSFSDTTCTDGIHLKSSHDTPISKMMMKVEVRRSPSPVGSSSYPPTFRLDIPNSFHMSPTLDSTAITRMPSRHNPSAADIKTTKHKANATQSTLATESEARVRSKWKLNPSSIASSKQQHQQDTATEPLCTKLLHRSTPSASSSSADTSSSSCSMMSADDNKDSQSDDDGESDTYSSDTSMTTNSAADGGGEGDSNSSAPDEGIGGCDDFFESTTINPVTPFNIRCGNEFFPDAISPFGFSVNNENSALRSSKTVSAMDLVSKNKRRRKKNIEIKSHLALPNFLHDEVEVRRLSVHQKEKLLMIDDLIASILECPNSYLMTKALLLSHRAFSTSMLLMKVLRRRFRVPHDYVDRIRRKEDEEECDVAFKIQLGISQLVYSWMHTYWEEDFAAHPLLRKEICEFQTDVSKFIVDKSKENVICKLLKEPAAAAAAVAPDTDSVGSQSGHSDINASRLEDAHEELRTRWPHLMLQQTKTIAVPKPQSFDVLAYKSSCIARQIVLMDYFVFREIRPREVVAQAWKKADKWERAQNLLRMINQFNSVCRWVQFWILNCGSSVKHRAKMMKHMICVANTLLQYQDFSALCAVHGALVSTPIKRLRREWNKVPKKHIRMIERISSLFEWNSPKLVQLHAKSSGPLIPHIGIILKNVISIEESNEYKADGTINTHKMNLLAQQIEMLSKWQRDCDAVYSKQLLQRKSCNKRLRLNQILSCKSYC